MIDKIIDRLKQPSTLKGAVALAGLLGYTVGPDAMANYALVLPLVIGILEMFRDEKK